MATADPAATTQSPVPLRRWLLIGGVVVWVALAVAVLALKHGAAEVALGLGLISVLVPVTVIDLERRLIPNRITGPGAIAAVAIGLVADPSGVGTQLLAGTAAFGAMLLFAMLWRGALGLGDVKLAGVMGLCLGASVAVALFVGVFAGAFAALFVLARLGVKEGRRAKMAYGPMLAFGGVVALFWGPAIIHWYAQVHH